MKHAQTHLREQLLAEDDVVRILELGAPVAVVDWFASALVRPRVAVARVELARICSSKQKIITRKVEITPKACSIKPEILWMLTTM